MNARPPNCGTGYCSCIECIYGKDGCFADEEQCNDYEGTLHQWTDKRKTFAAAIRKLK